MYTYICMCVYICIYTYNIYIALQSRCDRRMKVDREIYYAILNGNVCISLFIDISRKKDLYTYRSIDIDILM